MRNQQTIWESASRPLFVRSVWLEIARSERVRRGQRQRHFILDYKPGQQQQQLQQQKSLYHATSPSPTKNCGKPNDAALGHSLSCDLDCLRSNLNGSADDLLLIGSAKVQLHQPLASALAQQAKVTSSLQQKSGNGRRSSLLSKNSHSKHDNTPSRRLPERYELISRRGSFQDLQSTLSNGSTHPDERLAERVLNWLDLAGKTDVVKTSEELKVESATSVQRRESISRRTMMPSSHSTRSPLLLPPPPPPPPPPAPQRRIHASRKRSTHSKFASASVAATYSCHQRRPDSMKHITIIFNKEGIPVRLNRPARNIDLCSLAASAETTRRLAGALASARLYKNAVDTGSSGSGGGGGKGGVSGHGNGSGNNTTVTLGTARRQQTPRETTSERHNDDSAGKSYCFPNRLHEDFSSGAAGNAGSLHDSKKQLHIFMPSLPKKGLLTASLIGNSYAGGGGDDGASALSGSFNELCKL